MNFVSMPSSLITHFATKKHGIACKKTALDAGARCTVKVGKNVRVWLLLADCYLLPNLTLALRRLLPNYVMLHDEHLYQLVHFLALLESLLVEID